MRERDRVCVCERRRDGETESGGPRTTRPAEAGATDSKRVVAFCMPNYVPCAIQNWSQPGGEYKLAIAVAGRWKRGRFNRTFGLVPGLCGAVRRGALCLAKPLQARQTRAPLEGPNVKVPYAAHMSHVVPIHCRRTV